MTRLSPTAVLIWRVNGTLQIGVEDPLLIEGIAPEEAPLIEALASGTSTAEVRATFARLERVGALLDILDAAGALVPDEAFQNILVNTWSERGGVPLADLARRLAAARVLVHGPVRDLLSASAHRGGLAPASLAAVADSGGTREGDVAVVSSWHQPDWYTCARLTETDVPHVALVIAHDRVSVSPLVIPGQVPCTSCEYFRRLDQDPEWGDVAAALARRRPSLTTVDPALLHLSAARTVLGLRAWIATGDAAAEWRTVRMIGDDHTRPGAPFHAHCSCRHPPGRSAPQVPVTTATMRRP